MKEDFLREIGKLPRIVFLNFSLFALQVHRRHLYNTYVMKKHTFKITYAPTKEWRSKKSYNLFIT